MADEQPDPRAVALELAPLLASCLALNNVLKDQGADPEARIVVITALMKAGGLGDNRPDDPWSP